MDEERADDVARLESALGYRFADRELLYTALRHRSWVHQVKAQSSDEAEPEDNQRLEFLGDTVLSLCTSTLLFHRFEDLKEGELSRMRAGLVREAGLADMARCIGIGEAIFLGRGEETTGGREKNSILADAVEALMAAVYLDGGFDAAMAVVKNLWGDMIARSSKDDFLKDFKTRLQETAQATVGQTPEYRLTGSEGPDHALTFEVTLVLAGRDVSTGRGRSKKEAEQAAAQAALEVLEAKAEE
jgi:ribonuclease-3